MKETNFDFAAKGVEAMKTFKMFLKILGNHLLGIFLSIVMILFLGFLTGNLKLFSVFTTLIYIALMYSAGWNVGRKDVRKLPGCEPDIKKAVKASLLFAVIPVALLAFRVICPFVFPLQWQPYGEGFQMIQVNHPVTQISNIIYLIFFAPCIGFLQTGELLYYILPILIVPIFVPVGYLVGLRKFSIMDKYLPKVFYQNKDKNRKNSGIKKGELKK